MFENEYVECALPAQKSIALIAHDNKKKDMVEWCMQNKKILTYYITAFYYFQPLKIVNFGKTYNLPSSFDCKIVFLL